MADTAQLLGQREHVVGPAQEGKARAAANDLYLGILEPGYGAGRLAKRLVWC
jgi:hypothetical protein